MDLEASKKSRKPAERSSSSPHQCTTSRLVISSDNTNLRTPGSKVRHQHSRHTHSRCTAAVLSLLQDPPQQVRGRTPHKDILW